LKRKRALPRDNIRVVERMDVMKVLFQSQTLRLGSCLIETIAVQDNFCAKLPASRNLYQRSKAWHDNGNRDSKQTSVPGKPKRVVPCRSRNHSALSLLGRKSIQRVAGTSLLKAAGPLEMLLLAKDLGPGELAQGDGFGTRSVGNGAVQAKARGDNLR